MAYISKFTPGNLLTQKLKNNKRRASPPFIPISTSLLFFTAINQSLIRLQNHA
jgi:hypothetical protein